MKVAFIFPGQGSQNIGMGKEIYENFSCARELLQDISDKLKLNFKNILFEDNDLLGKSEFTQPSIILNSLMCYVALKSHINLKSEFSMGHSLGEFGALAVSGACDFLDVLELVQIRGKLMQKSCDGKDLSMMVILGLNDLISENICKKARKDGHNIYIANYNCDGQLVLAGKKDDLVKFESVFKENGAKRVMLLNMSVASHCPMLDSASLELCPYLQDKLRDTFLPIVSNVNAEIYTDKNNALMLLQKQLVKPVLYKQSILNFENDVDLFIEFGSNVLKGINKKITSKPTLSIMDLKSLQDTVNFLENK